MSIRIDLKTKSYRQRQDNGSRTLPTMVSSARAKSAGGNPEQFVIPRRRSVGNSCTALKQGQPSISARTYRRNSNADLLPQLTRFDVALDPVGQSQKIPSSDLSIGPQLPSASRPRRLSEGGQPFTPVTSLTPPSKHSGALRRNQYTAFVDSDSDPIQSKSHTLPEFPDAYNEKAHTTSLLMAPLVVGEESEQRNSVNIGRMKSIVNACIFTCPSQKGESLDASRHEDVHEVGKLLGLDSMKSHKDLDREFEDMFATQNGDWDPEVGTAPERMEVYGVQKLRRPSCRKYFKVWSHTEYVDALTFPGLDAKEAQADDDGDLWRPSIKFFFSGSN